MTEGFREHSLKSGHISALTSTSTSTFPTTYCDMVMMCIALRLDNLHDYVTTSYTRGANIAVRTLFS